MQDAGTPALTFGRLASRFDLCRDIGYVYDVRLLFAPLAKAIKMGEGVKPFKSDLSPGETLNLELVRAESQGST